MHTGEHEGNCREEEYVGYVVVTHLKVSQLCTVGGKRRGRGGKSKESYYETGDAARPPAQLAGWWWQIKWNVYGEEQNIFYWAHYRAAKAGQKFLVPARWAQQTNQHSYALLESPFASVSTVSTGHPLYSLSCKATKTLPPLGPSWIELLPV